MAEIFKARRADAESDHWVVLKRLLPHLAKDQKMVQMFMHEADMASRVGHPNVVPALDWGQVGSDWYLTQSFVPGVDLQTVMKTNKRDGAQLSLQQFVYIFQAVCAGLHACHILTDSDGNELNLVHRDVTPENILLCFDGRILLTDFGIASSRLIDASTKHGAPKGKTRYLSPEQARLEQVDGRSDLFSLASVMYEFLNGEPLFDGPNQFVILDKIRRGQGLPIGADLKPDYPAKLIDLIKQTLSFDPEDRPRTADELQTALSQFSNTAEDLSKTDLAMWLEGQFKQKIIAAGELNERHIRLDILDGEVIEHAPPRLDKTGAFERTSFAAENSRIKTSINDIQTIGLDAHADGDSSKTTSLSRASANVLDSSSTPTPGETLDISHPFTQITDESSTLPDEQTAHKNQNGVVLIVLAAIFGAALASLTLNLLPRQDTGLLLVHTRPATGLTISLNGKAVAERSPLAIKHLAPGQYNLELKDSNGQTKSFTSTVTAGRVARFAGTLKNSAVYQSTITIEPSPADANILVDKKSLANGTTFETTVGQTHALRVSKKGYLPVTRTVRVHRAGRRTIKLAMQPIQGTLFVDSSPNGTVFINGRRRGRTPLQLDETDINERWTIKIEAPGHKTYEKTVTFGSKQTLQIDAVLVPTD